MRSRQNGFPLTSPVGTVAHPTTTTTNTLVHWTPCYTAQIHNGQTVIKVQEMDASVAGTSPEDLQPMFTCHACYVRNPVFKSNCTTCGTARTRLRKHLASRETAIRDEAKDEAMGEGRIQEAMATNQEQDSSDGQCALPPWPL